MLRSSIFVCCVFVCFATKSQAQSDDPLSSWNDTEAKARITSFVEAVTSQESDSYVAEQNRVAVFDNDGCLWCEKPVYFQLLFALDEVRAKSAQHPEWKSTEPFKRVLDGDLEAISASSEEELLEITSVAHSGMTADAFRASVQNWLRTQEHPTLGRPFTELVYKPQLELLEYLRNNGFKTYIVSGGGIDFLRVFAEEVYGIPPEQVIGSSVDATYELRDGVPVIVKQPKGLFINDKSGKPVGIYQHIGRRPILAVGNSDGDFQMLEYTTAGKGSRLGILVHHDDAEREFAYDRDSSVGRLSRGLDEAAERGWLIISMKKDWGTVFSKD